MTLPLHPTNALTASAGNYPALSARFIFNVVKALECFNRPGVNVPIYVVAKDKKSVAGFSVKVGHKR